MSEPRNRLVVGRDVITRGEGGENERDLKPREKDRGGREGVRERGISFEREGEISEADNDKE